MKTFKYIKGHTILEVLLEGNESLSLFTWHGKTMSS